MRQVGPALGGALGALEGQRRRTRSGPQEGAAQGQLGERFDAHARSGRVDERPT